jgi:hypothetical protein
MSKVFNPKGTEKNNMKTLAGTVFMYLYSLIIYLPKYYKENMMLVVIFGQLELFYIFFYVACHLFGDNQMKKSLKK